MWVMGTEFGPLQEKSVLLSAEPSLQHRLEILKFASWVRGRWLIPIMSMLGKLRQKLACLKLAWATKQSVL